MRVSMGRSENISMVPFFPDAPLAKGDVLRGVRYGNRNRHNYVVDQVLGNADGGRALKVVAHREYNGQSGRVMLIAIEGARVLRSYR